MQKCGQVRALLCLKMANGLERTLMRVAWKARGIGMYQCTLPAQEKVACHTGICREDQDAWADCSTGARILGLDIRR